MVFRAAMGHPELSAARIPVNLPTPLDRVIDQPLDLASGTVRITATSMGNPHCSIFVDDFDAIDWRRLGAEIETDPRFPERTNVEFIRLIDRELWRDARLRHRFLRSGTRRDSQWPYRPACHGQNGRR